MASANASVGGFVFAFDSSLVDAGLSLAPCSEASARSSPPPVNVSLGADGDRFHRRVSGALSAKDRREKPPAASASAEQLCATLRRSGLHALLVCPGSDSAAATGAARNGGDGYFCSRQPYVVVHRAAPRAASAPAGVLGAGGGWVGGLCTGGAAARDTLLVEPHLRELFRVTPSTPEYGAAVEQLPDVWVGTRAALLELAGGMCAAMARNFRSQGLDAPPWRRAPAVLARWDERNAAVLPYGWADPKQQQQQQPPQPDSMQQPDQQRRLQPLPTLPPSAMQNLRQLWTGGQQQQQQQQQQKRQQPDAPAAACGGGGGGRARWVGRGPVQPPADGGGVAAGCGSGLKYGNPQVVVYGFEVPGPARAC